MNKQINEKDRNMAINEEVFRQICLFAPVLRDIRERQKAAGGNAVELFANLFEKLRGLDYAQNLDKKYEYLFNIIEMGSLIDAMGLRKEELPAFLLTVKDYRNVVADACHALSKEDSDGIVRDFCNFLRTAADNDAVKIYESNFQRTANGKKLLSYLNSGDQEQKDAKIVKLLSPMKYFFDKAKRFVLMGNLDAACLAYIAGANCARDFKRYYCESAKLNLVKCLELPVMVEKPHIRDILIACRDLNKKRDDDFAHLQDDVQKMTAEKFLRESLCLLLMLVIQMGCIR